MLLLYDAVGAGQVAQEVFLLSRVVRTFSTEAHETARYKRRLLQLRRISIRQAVGYLMYLTSVSTLFNSTKARRLDCIPLNKFALCSGCFRKVACRLCNMQLDSPERGVGLIGDTQAAGAQSRWAPPQADTGVAGCR